MVWFCASVTRGGSTTKFTLLPTVSLPAPPGSTLSCRLAPTRVPLSLDRSPPRFFREPSTPPRGSINTNRRLSCRYSSARRASPKSFRETAPAAGWLVPLQPPRFLTTTIIPWDAAIAATDNERATRKYAGSQLDVVLRVRIGLNPLPEGAP